MVKKMNSKVCEEIDLNIKCCWNCKHLDKRTKFCRLNPPSPVVYIDEDGYSKVSSKFPVICSVNLDYCSSFENAQILFG